MNVAPYQLVVYPKFEMESIPELWAKMCDMEKEMLYKAMYSPCLPLLALSNAQAFENGKIIISPTVIKSIPTINIPVQPVRFRIKKLAVTSSKPIAILCTLELDFSSIYLIKGISNTKIIKPFIASKRPIWCSLNEWISL